MPKCKLCGKNHPEGQCSMQRKNSILEETKTICAGGCGREVSAGQEYCEYCLNTQKENAIKMY